MRSSLANYFGGVDIVGPWEQNLARAHCSVGGFDNDSGLREPLHKAVPSVIVTA